ncbi:hypothetical protein TNIN_252951 [Trichonephila inaurata madagascariensis]|uniref:Uncharacterized protein n=1 Tax=Trichonephila inaurata madagascariensis TaxID=2747483 RepID=A0A8X6WX17_9ARAC|nr:hypothetical protein TNIN_252951 [Trichonephila inaurata madagascariensis]
MERERAHLLIASQIESAGLRSSEMAKETGLCLEQRIPFGKYDTVHCLSEGQDSQWYAEDAQTGTYKH